MNTTTTGSFDVDWEQFILHEIANPHCKRRDISHTYAILLALCQEGRTVNFVPIAEAILGRWSWSGLEFIVRQAVRRVKKGER